jgi:hypothetical protein
MMVQRSLIELIEAKKETVEDNTKQSKNLRIHQID